MSIYPNPNNGRFTLDFGTLIPDNFSISNTLGVIVYQDSQINPIEIVDLRHFAPRVYYVIYHRDGIKWAEKLLIQQ